MAHALAAHDASGHQHAALITGNALVADAFVFTTVTLPVFGRAKDLFTEQTVFFGLLCAVIDSFWLGDFAVRPI